MIRSLIRSCGLGKGLRTFSVQSESILTTDQATLLNIPPNSTIFSLIQPTGQFHLGNYFGAVKVWRDITNTVSASEHLRDNTQLIFGLADLHAITVPQDPGSLRQRRTEAIASILASGIDPSKAIIFSQSDVPQHCELFWILATVANLGSLNRMTQFKSKAHIKDDGSKWGENIGSAKLGLFSYPVLQAADILLYKSTHVPVGQDQQQHLELTREIATAFNKLIGKDYYTLPKTLFAPTKKIASLREPEKKMSKSDKNELSKILITESPESIRTKISKAVTDSLEGKITYDPQMRPGVSNLINICNAVRNEPLADTIKDVESFTKQELKNYTAELTNKELEEPRRLFNDYMKNSEYLNKVVIDGNLQARAIAVENLKEIKNLMGLS